MKFLGIKDITPVKNTEKRFKIPLTEAVKWKVTVFTLKQMQVIQLYHMRVLRGWTLGANSRWNYKEANT